MKKQKEKIVVWFSCGAASAVAAKKTIELFGKTHDVLIVNTPVLEEDSDNRRFLHDVEKWIGQEIIIARNENIETDSAVDVWEKRKFMSGVEGAPCTQLLKKEARYQFEKKHQIKFHVLGFTFEEINRHADFILKERHNVLPILICQGISKKDCFKIIQQAGIKLPNAYLQGYPNANCIGCVKATSPTYWNHVRKNNPDVFENRAEQSRRIGAKLVRVKGDRIYLDQLQPDAKGRPMKSLDFECGIFCYKD